MQSVSYLGNAQPSTLFLCLYGDMRDCTIIYSIQHTTVNTLLSSNGLGFEDVNTECRYDHLYEISKQLENWEQVVMRLGLTQDDIDLIKRNNPSMMRRRLDSLNKWKSMTGTATYRVLLQALLGCGYNDQATQVCSLLKKSLLYQERSLMATVDL